MADDEGRGLCASGELSGMRAAVFLDRDGVVVENRVDHVKAWEEVQFLEGAFEAIRRLAASPFAIAILSNQGAVGRSLLTLDAAWEVQRKIVAEIIEHGGRIDGSYLCPHHPEDGCDCRKPAPGMLHRAARELDLDLKRSWLVGDALTDLQAAATAGGTWNPGAHRRGADQELLLTPDAQWPVAANLLEAVQYIFDNLEELHS